MLHTIDFDNIWPELLHRPADEPVSQDDRAEAAALVADLRRGEVRRTQELPTIETRD